MSRAKFEVVYDGPGLGGHAMDLHQLAPALLALGNLIREVNQQLNGEKSTVNVFVQSDAEHKCFSVSLEIVQGVIDHLKSLLQDDNVKTAKDILEWLGLVGGSSSLGILGYLRWRAGRPVTNVTKLEETTEAGRVTVQTGDGSKVTINQKVYQISENPTVKRHVAGVIAPLKSSGIDRIEFYDREDRDSVRAVRYDDEDAIKIRASCDTEAPEIDHEPQIITAHLAVHSPVFDPKAPRWRFKYDGKPVYVDISETTIAQDSMARGGVMVNEVYKVRMEITEHETADHLFRNSYKILKVLEFHPAPAQGSLFTDQAGGNAIENPQTEG